MAQPPGGVPPDLIPKFGPGAFRRRRLGPNPFPAPINIPFPILGVDKGMPVAQQPRGTCPDALNVVAFPSLSDRVGGGKRDGTSKESPTLFSSIVAGDTAINHMQVFLTLATGLAPSGGGIPTTWTDTNLGTNGAGTWLLTYTSPSSLYVSGAFTTAGGSGGAERFALYNTVTGVWTSYDAFNTSITNPARSVTWDAGDGSGSCVYDVGGKGTTPNKQSVSRWNGSAWTDMLGIPTGGGAAIYAIAVYHGKLYVAGDFTALNGHACTNIGVWDPTTAIGAWAAVSDGTYEGVSGGIVYCMAVLPPSLIEPSGDILCMGGTFTQAGNVLCKGVAFFRDYGSAVARWNSIGGSGTGPTTTGLGTVQCMTAANLGNGNRLYIGGSFGNWNSAASDAITPGGEMEGVVASDHSMITSWDGIFHPLAGGLRGLIGSSGGLLDYGVLSMEFYNDGISPGLWVSGRFNAASTGDGLGLPAPSVAKWDGSGWTVPPLGLAGGVGMSVRHMIPAGPANDQHLYATGSFTTKNNVAVNGIAKWDGTAWACFAGAGCPNPSYGAFKSAVRAAVPLLHDLTPRLYISLVHATPATYSYVLGCGSAPPMPGSLGSRYSLSAWDGTGYREIPSWTDYLLNPTAMLDANIGTTGNKLYVTGAFTEASGAPRNRIAAWDGVAWTGLSANAGESALQSDGYALATDGTVLYVGGAFTKVTNTGAVDVANSKLIAKWTASTNTWSALTATNQTGTSVDALWYDSGSTTLYVGGLFSLLGGVAATVNVGTFAAGVFAPLDLGLNGRVLDITFYGGIPYACGTFTQDGRGSAMRLIAKWDSGTTRWLPVGGGITGGDTAHALFVHDDGSGSKLYVGGNFTGAVNGAATTTTSAIAAWDGTRWTAVDRVGSVAGGFGGRVDPPRVTGFSAWENNLVAVGGFVDCSGDAATYVARGDIT